MADNQRITLDVEDPWATTKQNAIELDVEDPWAVKKPKEDLSDKYVNEDRGFIGDLTSRAARGAVQAAKGIGGALRMSDFDPDKDEGLIGSTGKKITDWADEATKKYDILKPDVAEAKKEEGFVKRGLGGAIESTPSSLLPLVGAFGGAKVGALAGSPLGPAGAAVGAGIGATIGGVGTLFGTFGLGEYQNTYDETKKILKDKGVSDQEAEDKAHSHALTSAAAETGGEFVGDLAAATFFGVFGKTAVKQGVKQTIKQILSPGGVKEFAKATAKTVPFEAGSEVGTAYFQTESARDVGVTDMSTGEAMKEAVLPAVFMSLIFGSSIHGMQAIEAHNLAKSLNSTDPTERAKAAQAIYERIDKKDAESRKVWSETAQEYINSGKEFPLSKPIADFAYQKSVQDQGDASALSDESLNEAIQTASELVNQNPNDAETFNILNSLQAEAEARKQASLETETIMPQVETKAEQAAPDYSDLITTHAEQNGIEPSLLSAVAKADGGLMAISPQVAQYMGMQDAQDPDQNLEGGARYLSALLQHYQGDEVKALAAYKMGVAAVNDQFRIESAPKEVQDYIASVQNLNPTGLIDSGLRAGQVNGQPFGPNEAVSLIQQKMVDGTFTKDHLNALKDKHPVLSEPLNDLIAASLAAEINQAAAPITQGGLGNEESQTSETLLNVSGQSTTVPYQHTMGQPVSIPFGQQQTPTYMLGKEVSGPKFAERPQVKTAPPAPLSKTNAATVGTQDEKTGGATPLIGSTASWTRGKETFSGTIQSIDEKNNLKIKAENGKIYSIRPDKVQNFKIETGKVSPPDEIVDSGANGEAGIASPDEQRAKEPWEMTREEFFATQKPKGEAQTYQALIEYYRERNKPETAADFERRGNSDYEDEIMFHQAKQSAQTVTPPAKKVAPKKGPQNIITRIQAEGGLKVSADYSNKYLKQYPDLKRIIRNNGIAPDDMAAILKDEGYLGFETGDDLIELLKDGKGKETFTPENLDDKIESQIRSATNEWIEQQLAELEVEGIDAERIEASSGEVSALAIEDFASEGLIDPADEEAAIAELDDFFSTVASTTAQPSIKESYTEKAKAGALETAEIPGASFVDTFTLAPSPGALGEKPKPHLKNPTADMFGANVEDGAGSAVDSGIVEDIVSRIDKAVNARARSNIFVEEGVKAVPGIRLQDAEEAGRWAYVVAKGDATQEQFDEWIDRARKENRISKPEKAPEQAIRKVEKKNKPSSGLSGRYKGDPNEAREYPVAAENAFKKDLKRYAKELNDILGWEVDRDKKGKDVSATVNIAPVGGDGTIILWKPNSEYGIYIDVSVQREYNDDSLKIGGIAGPIMYRATEKKKKYTGFVNRWENNAAITPQEFAEKIKAEVDFYDRVPEATTIIKEAQDAGFTQKEISTAFAEGEKVGQAESTTGTPEEIQEKIDEIVDDLGVEVKKEPTKDLTKKSTAELISDIFAIINDHIGQRGSLSFAEKENALDESLYQKIKPYLAVVADRAKAKALDVKAYLLGAVDSMPEGPAKEIYESAADRYIEDAKQPVQGGKVKILTYEEFAQQYREAFDNSNQYSPKEVGFGHYTDKMAELADDYPEYLERFEAEEETKAYEKPSPSAQIADFVVDRLENHAGSFAAPTLFQSADKAYGGTQAQGAYTSKDAYDALELGVNKYIEKYLKINPTWNTKDAHFAIDQLKYILDRVPTQTKRTEETDQFQQFSTPPPLAYLANWVANIQKGETYLEPSAGIGGLAVFGKIAGAKVIVNELSPRRAEVIKEMGFDRLFTENAEQINNILPADVKPSVIVMNPPFSATAGRVEKTSSKEGFKHVEQALKRLLPNGRAVIILGKSITDTAAFKFWWKSLGNGYTLRADIGISGREYQKYGTTYGNQVIVIDKITSSPDVQTIKQSVWKVEDAIDILQGVRDARITTGQLGTIESDGQGVSQTGQGNTRPQRPILPATGKVGDRESQNQDRLPSGGTDQPNVRVESGERNEVRNEGEPRVGRPDNAGQEPGRTGVVDSGRDRGQVGGPDRVQQSEDGITVESRQAEAAKGELTDSVYESYTPSKLSIGGAKKHPGNLVESAAMGAVFPPDITYQPKIPKSVIESGKLSDAQMETVVYAGQAHSETLPSGQRRGYFIGDGTGVGKGREISGIILDNWNQGRRKAVWISQNSPLIKDAHRDAEGVGLDPKRIFDFSKIKAGKDVTINEGIAFLGYATLGSKGNGEVSRVEQIVNWLGADFDGVIAFDEAHNMGNAVNTQGARGVKQAAQKALAGIELQNALPNARVIYVSATGATEVSNFSYLERLGLWGEGTPFASKSDFITKISAGGIAAMELVARDMKAMGNYLARSLSYEDVKYDKIEHELTPDQREIYNELARAWQMVLANINAALQETGGSGNANAKSKAMSAFWGSHQRFFNQIITALQTPATINSIEGDLKNGHSAIIQLVNTNEAAQERALSRLEEDDSLEDMDMTPREQLMEYIRNSFPVAQYQEVTDADGNVSYEPVLDSNGNPVENAEAVAMREELLDRLGSIRVPDGPLEMIINHFGADKVAEVTGRSRRVVEVTDETGKHRVIEKRSKAKAMVEADAFMNDKRQILVFSQAGGTGRSYHADNTAENRRLRRHYLLQAGWRADVAIQGFGRSHRTNQAQAPEYILVTTDIVGQKRFISSIARRLDQLGALTKGERKTGSGGFFTARDNLESTYASEALTRLIEDIYHHSVPGMDMSEFMQQTGLTNLVDRKTGQLNVSNIPTVPKFLNRLLSMELDAQTKTFEAFSERIDQNIRRAMENGTLDVGMETLRAKKVEKVQEQSVFTDRSGAETKYVELRVTQNANHMDFTRAQGFWRDSRGFYKNLKSNQVWLVSALKNKTNTNTGSIEGIYHVIGPKMHRHDISEEDLNNTEKYVKLTDREAEGLWTAEYDELPKEISYPEHLITGTLLPIWDRLPQGHSRIIRVQTDKGERMIGRIIQPTNLQDTLRRLGASSSTVKMSPKEILDSVKHSGMTIELANGWTILRRKVSGENRVEIKGVEYNFLDELKNHGAFTERISWETRLFIPTSAEGVSLIEHIIKNRPVVNVIAPVNVRENMGDDETAPRYSRHLPKEGEGVNINRGGANEAERSGTINRDQERGQRDNVLPEVQKEHERRVGTCRQVVSQDAKAPYRLKEACGKGQGLVHYPEGYDHPEYAEARKLASVYGLDLIPFKDTTDSVRGFINGKAVFVNFSVQSDIPFIQVAAHEISHYLSNRPINKATRNSIDVNSKAFNQYLDHISRLTFGEGAFNRGYRLDVPYVVEEYAADLEAGVKEIYGVKLADGLKPGKTIVTIQEVLESQQEAEANRDRGPPKYMAAAWHGSPHTFDKFSTDKIGTGEGAQAYGYGLYFAGKKEVAEFYKKELSRTHLPPRVVRVRVDGKPIGEMGEKLDSLGSVFKAKVLTALDIAGGDIDGAIYGLNEQIRGQEDLSGPLPALREKYDPAFKFLDSLRGKKITIDTANPGRLYQVELAPQEDEYLLWDRPLSEQSEKVKAALGKYAKKPKYTIVENKYGRYEVQDQFGNTVGNQDDFAANLEGALEFYNANPKYMNAARLYEKLSKFKKSDKAASDYLHSLGIRGIKYLDGSSRGKQGRYDYQEDLPAGWTYYSENKNVGIKNAKGLIETDGHASEHAAHRHLFGDAPNYNYVIFHEDDVAIKARYKILDGAASAAGPEKPRMKTVEELVAWLNEQSKATEDPFTETTRKQSSLSKKTYKQGLASTLVAEDRAPDVLEYDVMPMQEQADLAADLINKDIAKAKRIALGQEEPEGKLRKGTVYRAVELWAHDQGDTELIAKLIRSPISLEMTKQGQEIAATRKKHLMETLGMQYYESPVNAVKDIEDILRDQAEKKTGKKVSKEAIAEAEALEKKVSDLEQTIADQAAEIKKYTSQEYIDELIKKHAPAKEGKTRTAKPKAEYGAKNKVFTQERHDKALNTLKGIFGRVSANPMLDPQAHAALVELGGYHFEAGARKFAEWAQRIVDDVGPGVKPHLRDTFEKVKDAFGIGLMSKIKKGIEKGIEKGRDLGELQRHVNDLAISFIEEGVTDGNELVEAVYNELQQIDPDITLEETRDAISGYGKWTPLTHDEVLDRYREIKQEQQLLAKIRDLEEQGAMRRTGTERQEMTQLARDLNKQVHALKIKYGMTTTEENQLPSALESYKKRLNQQIADLDEEIKSKQKIVKEKFNLELDAEAKELIQTRDSKKAEREAIFGKPEMTDEQRIKLAIQSAKKATNEYNRRIAEHDFSSLTKKGNLTSEELTKARKDRDDAKKAYQELREAENPGAAAMKALETRLNNELNRYKQMIANRDFVKQERKPRNLSPELKRLMEQRDTMRMGVRAAAEAAGRLTNEDIERIAKLASVVTELREAIDNGGDRLAYGAAVVAYHNYIEDLKGINDPIKTLLSNRIQQYKAEYKENPGKAIFNLASDSIKSVFDNSVAMVASFDDSFMGRQGLKVLFTHPSAWWPGAKNSVIDFIKTLGGQETIDAMKADIYSRPNFVNGSYGKAGIIAAYEEQYPANLAERAPVIGRVFKASEAAFVGSGMRMRADLYDLLADQAKSNGKDVLDQKEFIEPIGKLINNLTARGSWGKHRGESRVTRLILWAPKMLMANINTLVGVDYWTNLRNPTARREAGLNWLKVIGTTALIMAVASALGGDDDWVEWDPRSTDFGKIKIGDTRFDITGGMGSIVVLAARIITGKKKSATTGIVQGYTGDSFRQSRLDAFVQFLINKTTPPMGIVRDWLEGKTPTGERFTPEGAIYRAMTPIAVQNFIKLKDSASADRLAGAIVDVFGINTSSYSDSERQWNPKGSQREQQLYQRVGEKRFQELNKEYNTRVDSHIKELKRDPTWQRMSDEDKQAKLEKGRERIKAYYLGK